jgi:hypothetical protein
MSSFIEIRPTQKQQQQQHDDGWPGWPAYQEYDIIWGGVEGGRGRGGDHLLLLTCHDGWPIKSVIYYIMGCSGVGWGEVETVRATVVELELRILNYGTRPPGESCGNNRSVIFQVL